MALAPVVYCLWQRFLRFDPTHPIWPNRDRFVLSVGHVHAALRDAPLDRGKAVNAKYETLGQPSVTLEDIKRFRQLTANAPAIRNTAGHRESRPPRAVNRRR
jgi:transketolase